MELLGFPRGLVRTNGVVLILLASRLLPLAAHAFAGAYRMVRGAKLRPFDRDALARLARGAKNAPTRGANLRDAVLCEDAFRELRAGVVITPRPKLRLA
jgi:hypothetical protein